MLCAGPRLPGPLELWRDDPTIASENQEAHSRRNAPRSHYSCARPRAGSPPCARERCAWPATADPSRLYASVPTAQELLGRQGHNPAQVGRL